MEYTETGYKALIPRAVCGGLLMGLANLVPGISGGTMLLAAGIYTAFIGSIAELTTLKFRMSAVVTLGTVVACAALAILLGAGVVKQWVVDYRWIMYSLFIGLTLGGVPLVRRLAAPVGPSFWYGTVAGFLVMVAMALGLGAGRAGGDAGYLMLFFSGMAGAASMILPGISGGYLLLLLGQYEHILGAVDQVKTGLKAADMAVLSGAFHVVIPVGLGVVVGVVGVSNLLKWLLARYEKPTLGVLFGLLLGAVIGLWPFQQGRPPRLGELFRGMTVTPESLALLKPEKWPLEYFTPDAGQIAASIGLIAVGLAVTLGIERLGRRKPEAV